MENTSTDQATILQSRQHIQEQLRQRVRTAIEEVLDEEVASALGSARHERTDARCGYRHGRVTRTVTTPAGTRRLQVPRARVVGKEGTLSEFQSAVLPRYARRMREVDEAILGCYLGGHEQPPHPAGAGVVAGRRASVEERRLAGGRPAEGTVKLSVADPSDAQDDRLAARSASLSWGPPT